MKSEREYLKENMLEWWDIFSKTGEIHDARGLIWAIREYDNCLAQEEEMEM